MKGFSKRIALRVGSLALCLATAGCSAPLNVTAPLLTAPGNFTVTADDVNAAIANAAALQQASATCAALGFSQSQTVNSSATAMNGRHYFTLDFGCL